MRCRRNTGRSPRRAGRWDVAARRRADAAIQLPPTSIRTRRRRRCRRRPPPYRSGAGTRRRWRRSNRARPWSTPAPRGGPTGKVYGLDLTDEMLALARENQQKAGATNVEFLKGSIESIPLPDNSVDVITSHCVIHLAADKDAALRE